ncbi:hypothetical protein [Lysinibacillus sp. G4S2]|uniref:hypothetical protein n=1 Tax=Lysinibacillus sp. G4S2 TaxID=3055859 RepID=UPI0025A2563C|nr:hypothetical protein [Lysinibacillus sp. G4S2]MDM5246279.1 hypothetical protein [Lysinibacillus sp. G4S2]
MAIKMNDEKILKFLEMIKPKIKKELLQANFQDREDLEQKLTLFIVKFLKENEFEEVDFFELLKQSSASEVAHRTPPGSFAQCESVASATNVLSVRKRSVSNKCFL